MVAMAQTNRTATRWPEVVDWSVAVQVEGRAPVVETIVYTDALAARMADDAARTGATGPAFTRTVAPVVGAPWLHPTSQ